MPPQAMGQQQCGQDQAATVVTRANAYFARWYATPIHIPAMAAQLGIDLDQLEASFERYRGRTAHEVLTQFRLRRLCEAIQADPSGWLTAQAEACGFSTVHQANRAFLSNYCQTLAQFRQQARRARAWRADQGQRAG